MSVTPGPIHKYLATLLVDAAGDGTYVSVGSIKSIKPPKGKWGKSNTSHLASSGKAKTSMSGWFECDSVEGKILYDSTKTSTLFGYGGVTKNWKIRYNDGSGSTTGSVWAFSGYINEIGDEEISEGDEDPIMTGFKIEISGGITFTAGS